MIFNALFYIRNYEALPVWNEKQNDFQMKALIIRFRSQLNAPSLSGLDILNAIPKY